MRVDLYRNQLHVVRGQFLEEGRKPGVDDGSAERRMGEVACLALDIHRKPDLLLEVCRSPHPELPGIIEFSPHGVEGMSQTPIAFINVFGKLEVFHCHSGNPASLKASNHSIQT
ncbi:hypothetical protein OV207_02520 [Corallococcus sp. BB11-1]|nr:hypothetical protein [Corallococcus sp. BB11-1]